MLILAFQKSKRWLFKALLGLAAIIITGATDGPSFAWLLEGRGASSEAAAAEGIDGCGESGLMSRKDKMLEMKCLSHLASRRISVAATLCCLSSVHALFSSITSP